MRFAGSIVVSPSSSAFISPRPLKRLTLDAVLRELERLVAQLGERLRLALLLPERDVTAAGPRLDQPGVRLARLRRSERRRASLGNDTWLAAPVSPSTIANIVHPSSSLEHASSWPSPRRRPSASSSPVAASMSTSTSRWSIDEVRARPGRSRRGAARPSRRTRSAPSRSGRTAPRSASELAAAVGRRPCP